MSLEAVLLLFSAFATGITLTHSTWVNSIALPGGLLTITLAGWVAFFTYLGLEAWSSPKRRLAQYMAIIIVFGGTLINLAGQQVAARRGSQTTAYRNDGAAQSVEAAKFLIRGINPYAADFSTTPFAIWPSANGLATRNIAYDHYAYPPLTFLVFVPPVLLHDLTGWAIDYQLFYFIVWLAMVVIISALATDWTTRHRLLILTLGNPFLWAYAFAGYNDTLFLLGFLAAVLAATRRRWALAGACLGLSLASKQTAWLLLPPVAVWLWANYRRGRISFDAAKGFAAATLVTTALVVLPFLAWNPAALYDDTVRYVAGVIPDSFPISGTTVIQYLRVWGFVPSPWSPVAVWPIQLAVLLPTFWMVARWIRSSPTISRLLAAGSIILLVAVLFNRVGAENYFVSVLLLAVSSYAANRSIHGST